MIIEKDKNLNSQVIDEFLEAQKGNIRDLPEAREMLEKFLDFDFKCLELDLGVKE